MTDILSLLDQTPDERAAAAAAGRFPRPHSVTDADHARLAALVAGLRAAQPDERAEPDDLVRDVRRQSALVEALTLAVELMASLLLRQGPQP